MENQPLQLSVSEFLALTNQILDGAFPSVVVEGEVTSFKVNQGKFVFFDIKDDESSVGCFMMLFALRQPIEDGMRVRVVAQPKLTKWGKFSLTVRTVQPVGEGALKKSFELLRAKLEKEGLFAAERKRPLPTMPAHIAVISSKDAAGYKDFITILNNRWGGVRVDTAHVQVQGEAAPDQIIRALEYFNQQEELPELIAILRGGGSADDLAAFNDEQLVRAIAASRVPVVTGIGHEVDTSLADMAADVRAATPTNAAQLIVPDRDEVRHSTRRLLLGVLGRTDDAIRYERQAIARYLENAYDATTRHVTRAQDQLASLRGVLRALDPEAALRRGYALVRGEVARGKPIEIERVNDIITAEVRDVRQK